MGAGGDGPCLASWLLRCAETSLSKWNPQPDWQAKELLQIARRSFGCSSGGFRGCPGTHSSPQSSQRTGSLLGMHPGKVGPVQNLPG